MTQINSANDSQRAATPSNDPKKQGKSADKKKSK